MDLPNVWPFHHEEIWTSPANPRSGWLFRSAQRVREPWIAQHIDKPWLLTAVSNQKQLDEIIIISPGSDCSCCHGLRSLDVKFIGALSATSQAQQQLQYLPATLLDVQPCKEKLLHVKAQSEWERSVSENETHIKPLRKRQSQMIPPIIYQTKPKKGKNKKTKNAMH